ncbi:protein of unknown function [Paraburkholderia kururiensis]
MPIPVAALLGALVLSFCARLALFRPFHVAARRHAFIAAYHDEFGPVPAHRVVARLDHFDDARRAAFRRGRLCGPRLAGARNGRFASRTAPRGGFGGPGLPDHEQLADVLDRRGVEPVANFLVDGEARFALVAEHADLDEFMGREVHLDLFENGVGQAFGADEYDRFERVRFGAQCGALVGGDLEGGHGGCGSSGLD